MYLMREMLYSFIFMYQTRKFNYLSYTRSSIIRWVGYIILSDKQLSYIKISLVGVQPVGSLN